MSEEYNNRPESGSQSSTPPPRFSQTVSEPPVQPVRQMVRVQLPPEKRIVTYAIIVVTAMAFVGQLAGGYPYQIDVLTYFGVKNNYLINQGQLWRLLTPVLLHGSWMHIAFNMYALHILGRELERFYGSARFLAVYLVCAFTGNVFSYLFTSADSLGASTAIFGLLGVYGLFVLRNKSVFGSRTRAVLRNVGQVLLINLIIGLSPGIDMWGHLGGLLGGAVLGWFGGVEYQLVSESVGLLKMELKQSVERFPLVCAAVVLGFGSLVVLNVAFF